MQSWLEVDLAPLPPLEFVDMNVPYLESNAVGFDIAPLLISCSYAV